MIPGLKFEHNSAHEQVSSPEERLAFRKEVKLMSILQISEGAKLGFLSDVADPSIHFNMNWSTGASLQSSNPRISSSWCMWKFFVVMNWK